VCSFGSSFAGAPRALCGVAARAVCTTRAGSAGARGRRNRLAPAQRLPAERTPGCRPRVRPSTGIAVCLPIAWSEAWCGFCLGPGMRSIPVALLVLSCGGNGTREMSAAAHDAEAARQAREAELHAQQYAAGPWGSTRECAWPGPGRHAEPICWSSTRNPTAHHLRSAARHAEEATKHRAVSATLREAEERACAGISMADRDQSPFSRSEDIVSVEAVHAASARAGLGPLGAVVRFRPVVGLTQERLQRLVDCHVARNAALGHPLASTQCPLVPKGVRATVRALGDGLEVEIRAEDGAEVLRRARLPLAPR
jgi:hypothetical protein